MDYNEIQKKVYELKYANDKADYLTTVYLQIIEGNGETDEAKSVAGKSELLRILRDEIQHYRNQALTETYPDEVVPRRGRPRHNGKAVLSQSTEPRTGGEEEIRQYITAQEVAKITHYAAKYVYDLANPKKHDDPLPRHKIGKKILFDHAEVIQWMERQAKKNSGVGSDSEVTPDEALSIIRSKMRRGK